LTTPEDIDKGMRATFEGNFLDASDIKASGDYVATIESISLPNSESDAAGKRIDKAIIAFKGAKKRLILNKVNSKIIAMTLGKKASEWIGKQVTLTVRYLDKAFGQRNVPVIRIKADPSQLTFGMRKNYGSPTPYAE
jgi:hypothetical protein